jgi:transaldolase
MPRIDELRIKLFSDGAKIGDLKSLAALPHIKGFTTNPSLMKHAGVMDYEAFVREALPLVGSKPISFEVFADDFAAMKKQALRLASFGTNVVVKIPVTNTKGHHSTALLCELTREGVHLNVTAVFTLAQVTEVAKALSGTGHIVSVFAGRIADTGRDPVPIMKEAKTILKGTAHAELLWASSREVLNIFQAEEAGCDIITLTPDLLKKIAMVGYELEKFSLDTVKMFYNDAVTSGFQLNG